MDRLQAALADRYAIQRELGRGATATVYLARDLTLSRPVAIKVLAQEFSLPVHVERFTREIATAARLTHSHILALHEKGTAGGFLYYAMQYAEGGSLGERLAREGRLDVDEAVRIACEVADGLEYAHRQGIVHRDVKPGNILFDSGHARIADFGIASVRGADAATLTATGAQMGTPAYMSPEQVTGDQVLDGRTDVYGLACVLYEMLTGEDPFRSPDVQSTMTRRVVEPPPPVRRLRPDAPEWLERVLLVAMATRAADRFATARAFDQALERKSVGPLPAPRPAPTPKPPWPWRRVLKVATPVVAMAVLVIVITSGGRALDPNRMVVWSVEGDSGNPAVRYVEPLLHDGFSRWRGIYVVDRQVVREAPRPLDRRTALRLAKRHGAGRYVRADVSAFGDSTRLHVVLYDVAGDSVLRERTIKLGPGLVRADSTFASLVDQLLFDSNGAEPSGTHSYAARLAFDRGQAAVREWELEKADSAFRQATDSDPDYAQAHLWVAQVRWWGGAEVARWRSGAERAASRRNALSAVQQGLSDALLAVGRGDLPRACATWQRLTVQHDHDFAAWYSLAACLSGDKAVVRDRTSPSGWRFRTSYEQAVRAYQRAFELQPSVHNALRNGAYRAVRRLLMTSWNDRRPGRAVSPDTTTFLAQPRWQGDSLAFVPYRWIDVQQARPWTAPREGDLAIQRQRERFHEIAAAWVAAFPRSAAAREALAVSIEMLGDPRAVDTLQAARVLATDEGDRLQIAVVEVWLRLKFAIPSDLLGLRRGRALADSLLDAEPHGRRLDPWLLASLAALTGRAHLAARLARDPAVLVDRVVPGPIGGSGPAFLMYGALGGPPDSLRILERDVARAIDNQVIDAQRRPARMEWLGRPAQLAFPEVRLSSIAALDGNGDYDVDAEAAFSRGDTARVSSIFDGVKVYRRTVRPADITLDGLYPEVWLLAAMGRPREAIAWLDPTLNALASTGPQVLADPVRAAALVRSMALRAELADQTGDQQTAQQWARAVTILWSNADEFLLPIVRRMERLKQ